MSEKPLIRIRDGETTIKTKFCVFEQGGGLGGREENRPKMLFLRGKHHDNKILKVQILLSRNFVVIAQAPIENEGAFRAFSNPPFVPPPFAILGHVQTGGDSVISPNPALSPLVCGCLSCLRRILSSFS